MKKKIIIFIIFYLVIIFGAIFIAYKFSQVKPKYESKYYATGYPDDEYGVCTDVVAFGLKDAGYDLMELVNDDIKANRQRYNIDVVDKNIDFRRTKNFLYK